MINFEKIICCHRIKVYIHNHRYNYKMLHCCLQGSHLRRNIIGFVSSHFLKKLQNMRGISTFGGKKVRRVVKCKIDETGQTLQTEKNICGIVKSQTSLDTYTEFLLSREEGCVQTCKFQRKHSKNLKYTKHTKLIVQNIKISSFLQVLRQ